ncbi:phage tail protein [Trinickia sp. YCB016]
MSNEFFTILTATGRDKLANATATGKALSLTHMAVGDGDKGAYYDPFDTQTALKHEVWRGALNDLYVDSNNTNWIVAELLIPDDVGGWYVREVGLYDSTGTLIAVGKFPESFKPVLASGSNKQFYVRMILEVSNAAAVTLQISSTVVTASRKYVDDKFAVQATEIVQGTAKIATQTATNTGTDDTTIVTPKKLFAWVKQATESVLGMAKVATQAQVNAGTDDATVVTPKKLLAWVKQATESVLGMAKVATQAQVNAGTDDATVVTPKKLRAGFSASLTATGYIAFPTWLGGLVVQWGGGAVPTGNGDIVYFPISFPSDCLRVVGTDFGPGCITCAAVANGRTSFRAYGRVGGNANYQSTAFGWIAIGY